MRVTFCYPAYENLGLEYLSAALRQRGHETRLVFDPQLFSDPFLTLPGLDRLFDHSRDLPARVAGQRPDLVAFSVVAANYGWALRAARGVKRLLDVPVVFGGVHAMAAPAAVLENPEVDYCVVGEGEQALCELAEALEQGRDPSGIANLCHRGRGGRAVINPLRPLVQDLDGLPFPDKELFYREIPAFARGYTVVTRRGCVNQCSYCHNTLWQRHYPDPGQRIRLRSVDNVLQELARAQERHRFRRLRINDDLFSFNTDWLVEFCQRYRREIGRPFLCFCSPGDLTDAVVAELKAAGCFQVCVGVQDVDEKVRREVYCRHTPQRHVERALANLRRHRLRATVDNILGHEGQTLRQMERISEFYLDNPVHGRFTVFWLIYFAGTTVTEQARQRGQLTAEQVAQLERRPEERANTLLSGAWSGRPYRVLHLFLVLQQMLPAPLARMLLRTRLYRLLPAFNPSLVEGLLTIFSRDRLDPVRERYYWKFFRFGVTKVVRKLTHARQ